MLHRNILLVTPETSQANVRICHSVEPEWAWEQPRRGLMGLNINLVHKFQAAWSSRRSFGGRPSCHPRTPSAKRMLRQQQQRRGLKAGLWNAFHPSRIGCYRTSCYNTHPFIARRRTPARLRRGRGCSPSGVIGWMLWQGAMT